MTRGAGVLLLRALGALLALAIVTAPAAPARADAEDAARAFEQGRALYRKRAYRQAAKKFLRAFELLPHGDAAYNAALSWEHVGERVLAAEAYAEALGRDLRDEARGDATARLERLRRQLGLLTVVAPEGSVVRVGRRRREAPAEFYVEPGIHAVVVVEPGGRERTRHVQIAAGLEREVEIQPETERGQSPRKPKSRAPPAAAPRARASVWPGVGWTGVAVGVALAGTAVLLGTRSSDAREEFNSSDRTDRDLRDRAVRLQTWTRVTWASAALLGGAGVVILLTSGGGEGRVEAMLSPAGAAVRAGF